MDAALEAGTIKEASSAYLMYLFSDETGDKSHEFRLNAVGPRTEPCTILAVMVAC